MRYSQSMRCPFCQNIDTKVIDTRESAHGNSIRRRRVCLQCGRRFTTIELLNYLSSKIMGKLSHSAVTKLLMVYDVHAKAETLAKLI